MTEFADAKNVTLETGRTPLQIMLAVWKALFIREILARLSDSRTAWLWMLIEPVAQIAVLMVVREMLLRAAPVPGVDFGMFLGIGIITYQMFRITSDRSKEAVHANKALFAYRQVKPVDSVIIRAAIEGVMKLVILVILLGLCGFFDLDPVPADPLLLIVTLFLMWMLGAGVGLVLSVVRYFALEAAKFISLAFIPLYFLSGVLILPEELPPVIREYVLWLPMLHGVETARAAFFTAYHPLPAISLSYLATWSFLSVLLGLALHVKFKERLIER